MTKSSIKFISAILVFFVGPVTGIGFQSINAQAHDLRARELSEVRSSNRCVQVKPADPFPTPPEGYRRKHNTIAHRFLDNEIGAGTVTPAMYAILDALIDEATGILKPTPRGVPIEHAKTFAADALRQIDCILLRHGFVYPGRGLVHLLSDGLEPIIYDEPNELSQLQSHRHNIRRHKFISARGVGPFYVVDCDTASFIYMAIAEVMKYPLQFVDIPSHNFVRWEIEGNSYINFETMSGAVTDDEYYKTDWGIPSSYVGRGGILKSMSDAETLSYHDAAVAIAWSWRGDHARMIDHYLKAISRSPRSSFALNNLAWYYAAVPKLELRDGQKAVHYALQAVSVFADGDTLDTLACAYAQRGQAGDFDLAMRTLEDAKKAGYAPFGSDFSAHKALFLQGKSCNDEGFGADAKPFRPRHGAVRMATDKELLRMR